jgi:Fe(3+) dicitrate transport protein
VRAALLGWMLLLALPGLAGAQPAPTPAPPPKKEVIDVEEELEEEKAAPADKKTKTRTKPLQTGTIEVKTSRIEETKPVDVYEHSGARTVITPEKIQESGANALPDALRKTAGVKVQEATGTGNTDTKLNIGVRGLSPRLTARSTVLLDEIPIVVAPYGQPQASLFPVSLFSIDSIDIVRGGAATRYGPQTIGGVINLHSRPIPDKLDLRLTTQTDHYGDAMLGASAGGTFGPVGIYSDYSFRGGRGYREHTGLEVHAGLAKLRVAIDEETETWLELSGHVFDEHSGLPGGLYPDAYRADPFQSLRPLDRFQGSRQGGALRFSHTFVPGLRSEVLGFYHHSFREYRLADEPEPATSLLSIIPREYHAGGVEPRLGWFVPLGEMSLALNAGYRFVFEAAHQEKTKQSTVTGESDLTQDDDNQLAAHAAYLEADWWAIEEELRLTAGLRFEHVQIRRRNNLEVTLLDNVYDVVLPGASVWWQMVDGLAAFASYSRSFGSPQFLQIGLATAKRQLTAEIADTWELGLKVLELGGIEASVTGFVLYFHDRIEFDETSFENIGASLHGGVESEIAFDLGEWAHELDGLEVELGYTYTKADIVDGPYLGKEAPWSPDHAVWADVSYGLPIALPQDRLSFGASFWWDSEEYTDAKNSVEPDALGSVGLVGPTWSLGVWARYAAPLTECVALEVRMGLKNLTNHLYFDRTDDENAGMLLGRPLTFWAGLGLKWVPEGL